MQISQNTQSVYPKSTSFGMALKITPAAKEALEKATMKEIEQLQKAGEALKDTKYYHLEIGENLTPRIDSPYANAYTSYFKPIQPTQYDQFFSFETKWDGTTIAGRSKGQIVHPTIMFDTAEQAQKAYAQVKDMHYDIDRATALTKMLDDAEIKKQGEKDAAIALKAKIKAAAQDLMDKFGAESHVKY